MPNLFVFTVTGPAGTSMSATFELSPGRRYSPAEVSIQASPPVLPGARTLSVNSRRLPDVVAFQEMAALAAARAAQEPRDEQERLNQLLFPLG